MNNPLRILFVDDNPHDRSLAMRQLHQEFPDLQVQQVTAAPELAQALAAGEFDLVITDFHLHWTNGLTLLRLAKARYPERPVIMFTGTGNEEIAVQAMKTGLDDYVVKSPRHFARLPAAVRSALERVRERRALREAETRYRDLFTGVPVGLYRTTAAGQIIDANPTMVEMLGYAGRASLLAINAADLYLNARDRRQWQALIEREGLVRHFEVQLRRRDGTAIWVEDNARVVRDGDDQVLYYEGSLQDISERVQAEAALRQRNRELGLLNHASRTLNSTLDLDRVLATLLEEVRRLLGVVATSVWLTDPATGELVCHQATGVKQEVVRGWRLAPGEGIAGWVAQNGESLVVSDARQDERHFKGVDLRTGLTLCSVLSVPLRASGRGGQGQVIGTLQVVDTEVGRFRPADLALLEPLAASAASAIENARLYEALHKERDFVSAVLDTADALVLVLDPQGRVVRFNQAGERITGYACNEVQGKLFEELLAPEERASVSAALEQLHAGRFPNQHEHDWLTWNGERRRIAWSDTALLDQQGQVEYVIVTGIDITARRQAQAALLQAIEESDRLNEEVLALLEGSRAVLKYRAFKETARTIFELCKHLSGARAGYVALLSPHGTTSEILFLDPGGLACTVDPALPMPLCGLREQACRSGTAVYRNDFARSAGEGSLPPGHIDLENVLFAPLVIEGQSVGLLGLANKPGGFTDHDARMAAAFGELAAIALLNSRTLESLEQSEKRFRAVVETANDAIITVDERGRILFWNPAAQRIFGYTADQVAGQPLSLVVPGGLGGAHQQGTPALLSSGESGLIGKTIEMMGLSKEGREFPIELSLAAWQNEKSTYVTGIVRDVSERGQEGGA